MAGSITLWQLMQCSLVIVREINRGGGGSKFQENFINSRGVNKQVWVTSQKKEAIRRVDIKGLTLFLKVIKDQNIFNVLNETNCFMFHF